MEIIEAAHAIRADLIIMAAHSHTLLGRLFLGSNTDFVLHHCNCPVYVHKLNTIGFENKIIVPVDYTEVNKTVINRADKWAQQTDSELYFIHTEPFPEYGGGQFAMETGFYQQGDEVAVAESDQQEITQESTRLHNTLKAYLETLALKSPHQSILKFGKPYFKIQELQKKTNAGLIMMAAHSHTMLNRLFLGSNTDYVLHHCQCPVYVYKQHSREFANTIIVPIDYSEVNKSVIEQADIWTQRTGAVLYFIHTEPVSEYEEEDYAIKPDSFPEGNDLNWQEIRQRAKESRIADLHRTFENYIASCEVKSEYRPVFEFGKPYLKIQELQQETNAGLIMMAAHSHTLLNRLFVGSNTDYLLNHAPCPMYVYKE
ncbi:MAG: universal stress protein, partial [Desulfobacterales bacterium]|nr:universal stress protein [Desulfobacterales bacterium]